LYTTAQGESEQKIFWRLSTESDQARAMFNVLIRNELLYSKAVMMEVLFLAFCVLLAWSWNAFHCSRQYRRIFFGGAAVFAMVFFAGMVFGLPPHHDEVEHANAAWPASL